MSGVSIEVDKIKIWSKLVKLMLKLVEAEVVQM